MKGRSFVIPIFTQSIFIMNACVLNGVYFQWTHSICCSTQTQLISGSMGQQLQKERSTNKPHESYLHHFILAFNQITWLCYWSILQMRWLSYFKELNFKWDNPHFEDDSYRKTEAIVHNSFDSIDRIGIQLIVFYCLPFIESPKPNLVQSYK